jgi:PAS domain-containing protein
MNLVNELIKGLLPEQERKKIVAMYGGGFKPPTKGHFEVVQQALKQNPEIDKFIINIGGKERDGVTPEEAIMIWDIYKQYLPLKVEIQASTTPPIRATYDYAKNNPDEEVLFILGAREGNEDDFKDIAKRTKALDNYPNLELRTIVTQGGASGTAARQAGKISKEKLIPYLPDELKDEEVEEVYRMISDKVTEGRKPKKDPKKGTGKKPKGSGRRLYTDEDPKDTVGIKFSTRQDIVDTLNKKSFKAKSHARQSQIINLIHQRVRAALGRTKDPAKKKKLRSGFEYIKKRKEASKKKTQRLKKLKESKPFKREDTTFKVGQVLTFKGKKNRKTGSAFSKTNPLRPLPPQRDFPVEVVDVKWNEERNEYEYSLMLLRDLSRQRKRGLKMKFQSEEDIKRRLADKQLTRAEFERQATKRKDSFDKPITYKRVGHFEESKDPKKGTGKKPKGSGRRLYTDEDPKDTVGIKFSTRQDIVDTLNKKSFKAKSHARQSQIINLIHQRVRAALGRTKDPAKKKKLKSGFEYIKKRKEASKKKTQRLKKQKLNEVLDPKTFNFKPLIKSLTKSMENDGLKLKPYPKVQFVHNAESNADDFFGKTAYYMPGMNKIVLYTLGRHPKDIMRSYAHELIHVHQNMEDRLNDVNTTNTSEDDHLENIEREAYETGNISFRKWTDSLIKESKVRRGKKGDPFGINAYARELATLEENTNDYYIYLDMDGVVADFDKRFKDLSGFLPNDFVDKYGKNAFWDLIDEKHKVSFWRGIEVMPGAKKLVDFVSKYPYEMLTAPSVKKQSVIGKSLWIRDKVGTLYPSQPKVTYRAAKEKHNVKSDLTKNDILIDDKKSTIDSWNAKGGTAIFYQNADQVINDLQKLGL